MGKHRRSLGKRISVSRVVGWQRRLINGQKPFEDLAVMPGDVDDVYGRLVRARNEQGLAGQRVHGQAGLVILIVTLYNAQIRAVQDALAARGLIAFRVGTVDKFQGREAPVVI